MIQQREFEEIRPEVEQALRGYTFEQLDRMTAGLRGEIAAAAPETVAHLDTLCRLAPGSTGAAFIAIMSTCPREILPKVKLLRTLTLCIAAQERAALQQ